MFIGGLGRGLDLLERVSYNCMAMFLTYFDESGDTGVLNSPTDWFILNAVLVHETVWLDTLNQLVRLRRHLRDSYGIMPRRELKGMHFRKGEGAFEGLGIPKPQRFRIYEEIMEFEAQLNIKTFSVAIQKANAASKGWEPRLAAWKFAIERLHTFCSVQNDYATLFPDEGHGFFIRQLVRTMRRYNSISPHYGGQAISLPVQRVLEDPNDRRSQDSYFVQLADLNAYATHRYRAINPKRRVPDDLWDRLSWSGGDIRILEVNSLRGGPPGIKKYP